jgi:hypothetical protein
MARAGRIDEAMPERAGRARGAGRGQGFSTLRRYPRVGSLSHRDQQNV